MADQTIPGHVRTKLPAERFLCQRNADSRVRLVQRTLRIPASFLTPIIIISPTNAAPTNFRNYWANLDRAPAHDRMIVRMEYDVDDKSTRFEAKAANRENDAALVKKSPNNKTFINGKAIPTWYAIVAPRTSKDSRFRN
ncbi:hypothetical protein Trisim1_010718 [Trichoderma cf. simile WF8]